MSNKRFVGTFLLYIFFALVTAIDVFVIWDLATSLMGRNFLVTISTSMMFVAGIDLLPIFGLTPALNKIAKGVIAKKRGDYWATVFIILLSLALFLSLASIYLYMSVNYPQRFLAVSDSTVGNVISQAIANTGNGSGVSDGAAMRTAEAAARAAGILPFITTIISCFFHYLSIGHQCIEDEIKKLERLKVMHNRTLQKCAQNRVFLQNLREHFDVIKGYIDKYKKNCPQYIKTGQAAEQAAQNNAVKQIKYRIMEEMDALEHSGIQDIQEHFSRNANKMSEKLTDWKRFCKDTKDETEKELRKLNP